MSEMYQVSLVLLQTIIGIATGVTLIHFAVIATTRAVAGSVTPRAPDHPLRYFFMVPALNEELVIADTVKRLLAIPGDVSVFVIDDGSTDGTASIVRSMQASDHRVQLLQRVAPEARQGKGKALNFGYRHIARTCRQEGIDPSGVIVCVMDADGLLDRHVLSEVDGLFGHDTMGAVQIGVRIVNRETILGRLQDIEFFVYARIYQQGRNHLGSVGLGGNGQFTRLSALLSLGDEPWTECLTEDLDLGLQLLLTGWQLAFTDRAYVHQQGLVSLPRLVRQRARWVQGYFQSWRRIPAVTLMKGRLHSVVDLLYSLMWPAVSCLVLPIAIVLSWFVVGYNVATMDVPFSTWAAVLTIGYVFAFGTSILLGLRYRATSGDISVLRTIVLIHSIGLFQFVWAIAGWRSLFRIVRGQGSWAKTERVAPVASDSPTGA